MTNNKTYTATITINLHFEASDRQSAQEFLEDADIIFSHYGKPIKNDLIDWEIKETVNYFD